MKWWATDSWARLHQGWLAGKSRPIPTKVRWNKIFSLPLILTSKITQTSHSLPNYKIDEKGGGLDGREWCQRSRTLDGNKSPQWGNYVSLKKNTLRDREVTEWGKVLAPMPDHLTVFLRTQTVEEETKPLPGCHGPSICMSLHAWICTHTDIWTHTYTHKYKNEQ